ncbi:zinc finger protein 816-like [Vanessa atalanta]|uniref:zinc finger protein 816-like n=1 Tax=Vanessa atalanta TaxID=42275 RepID=UPI001FCDE233|nr:zinc finger protein 816-like [Vanessa atalanta]
MSYDLELLNSGVYSYDYFQQDDVCRFCFSRNAFTEIIELSSENNFNTIKTDLVEKILDCLNIDLSHCIHPNKACDECCKQINKFHFFKKFCQETDRKLREILNNNKSDKCENIKLEKDNGEIENDSLHDLYDDLNSDDCESKHANKAKIKVWKYKPKRTPTYCNMCMVDCENADEFKSHNFKYHGIDNDGSYKCFGCEKKFKNRKSRSSHEIHFCKGLKDGYKCNICNRYLPKRGMFEAHMRDHRENVPIQLPEEIFYCQKCDKLFKTMENLKGHIELEHDTDKKQYVCESCGRVFNRKDYLNKHKLTHTGEKLHVCPHCGFRARQRSSLTVHIRKHTGERPYRCNVCPQRCVSSSNLRAHQKRHLGLKVHECNICNKKFGYKVSLHEHMSTHAPAQTHACAQCGAAYAHARGLRRHVRAKHGAADT